MPLNTAPHPPDNFVPRPDLMEQAVANLLATDRPQPVALTTALQGGGGFGKTVLARYLCHAESVQAAFPDGILWLTIGQTPSLIELLNNQIRLFEPDASYTDLNAAAARLQDLLAGKRVLLVLDDVWQEGDATPFVPRHPGCTLLITTRQQDVALRLNAQAVTVNEMTTNQGAELLVSRLAERPDDLLPFRKLAAHLGEWPLLLNLAAAQLNELVQLDHLPLAEALADLWAALNEKGFTAFDRADEAQRNQAISISLELSLARLGETQRRQFIELAVFPEDIDIPFAAIGRLWTGLQPRQVLTALRVMQRLSLFTHYDGHQQTLRLHDVIRHYLVSQQQDLAGLHARLLNAYLAGANRQWADLPVDEPYLWDQVTYHLLAAGLAGQLRATVTDLRYLAQKSLVRTAAAMEADLRRAVDALPGDEQLQLLTRHVTNAGHLLGRCPTLSDRLAVLYSRLQFIEGLTSLCPALAWPHVRPVQPLPDLPSPALVRTLVGHTGMVHGCAISPDGRWLVSASADATLKVWELASGRKVRTLAGHTGSVSGCAISPDGRWLISTSRDKTLKVWELASGREVRTLAGHTDVVMDCAISPDGRWLVSASADATLKVWELASGREVRTLAGHTDVVMDCAISPDGRWLVSASGDQTLKVWELESGQEVRTLAGHTSGVDGCAISPDGRWLVSASHDKALKVWELASGQEVRTLTGHTDGVNGCVISSDGRWLVSASYDKTLKVWELASGQEVRTLAGHIAWVRGCAISPDGRWLVSASWDKTLKVWELASGRAVWPLAGYKDVVSGCAISPDGCWLVSASTDATLKVWELASGREVRTLVGHRDMVSGCAISPDGRWLVSASWDKTLKVWELASGQEVRTLAGHTAGVSGCAISSDGRWLVSASGDQTLKVWELASGQEVRTLAGHTAGVKGCAISSDGRWLVSASRDKTLKVWELASGRAVRTLAGHTGWVMGCAISPDGRWLVSASDDKTLKVWELASGRAVRTLAGHTSRVKGCAISPDGRWLVSASWDKTLKVWELESGHCLTTLVVEGSLTACAWDPDSERLVAVGSGGVYFLQFVV